MYVTPNDQKVNRAGGWPEAVPYRVHGARAPEVTGTAPAQETSMTTETSTPAANLRDVIEAALAAMGEDGNLEALGDIPASGTDADNLHFIEVLFRGRRLRVEVSDIGDAPAP